MAEDDLKYLPLVVAASSELNATEAVMVTEKNSNETTTTPFATTQAPHSTTTISTPVKPKTESPISFKNELDLEQEFWDPPSDYMTPSLNFEDLYPITKPDVITERVMAGDEAKKTRDLTAAGGSQILIRAGPSGSSSLPLSFDLLWVALVSILVMLIH